MCLCIYTCMCRGEEGLSVSVGVRESPGLIVLLGYLLRLIRYYDESAVLQMFMFSTFLYLFDVLVAWNPVEIRIETNSFFVFYLVILFNGEALVGVLTMRTLV